MGGPPYDFLGNPLGAVRLSFEKAVASGSHPSALDGKDWGALDLFRQFLVQNPPIPDLNNQTISLLQPNTLVRYRGMIQDMLGNEFYVGSYKDGSGTGSSWKTNKFADISQLPIACSSPGDDTCIWERRLLYCVPVPGQNAWTKAPYQDIMSCSSPQNQLKRRRIDDQNVQDMDMITDDDELEISQSAKKMREEGHSSACLEFRDSATDGNLPCSSAFQDVDKDSLPCLLKIYDSPESELKLNDVFEFIGVLTFGSEPTAETNDYDEISNGISDDALVHLPPNKVPRLHCLIHRRLAAHDFLHSSSNLEPKSPIVKEIRETLLKHLSTVLGNDEIAAHFVLLHLLSRVHARVDDVAVGKLSLNLSGLSNESVSIFGPRLSSFVGSVLPFTHCLPLTLEYLNTASLVPKKDYQINRLRPGVLQIAEGSHLIVDETQLKNGTLNAVGVENARSLKNLTEFQKVEYDFEYYKMEMAADIQLLVLSDGKSNIVPADIVLPLRHCSVDSCDDVTAETLEAWRWYLATIRSLPHSIESDMMKVVEDDLVAARQADRSLGSQDFSIWLTMGRLMSSSLGETHLSREHWQMVMELERLRRERLK